MRPSPAHDLHEPLRLIASYVGLLALRAGAKLDVDERRYLTETESAARTMRQLITSLLDFARVGRGALHIEPVDTLEALALALHHLSPRISDTQAVVTHGPLPVVDGDRTHLMLLFQNLIGNALKFVAKGVTPRVHIRADRASDTTWCFRIQDNGIGMTPEVLDRIFAAFERLHARADYQGTGLGLAICKRIVDRHHGRIWAESRPGEGSTFCVTLPARSSVTDGATPYARETQGIGEEGGGATSGR